MPKGTLTRSQDPRIAALQGYTTNSTPIGSGANTASEVEQYLKSPAGLARLTAARQEVAFAMFEKMEADRLLQIILERESNPEKVDSANERPKDATQQVISDDNDRLVKARELQQEQEQFIINAEALKQNLENVQKRHEDINSHISQLEDIEDQCRSEINSMDSAMQARYSGIAKGEKTRLTKDNYEQSLNNIDNTFDANQLTLEEKEKKALEKLALADVNEAKLPLYEQQIAERENALHSLPEAQKVKAVQQLNEFKKDYESLKQEITKLRDSGSELLAQSRNERINLVREKEDKSARLEMEARQDQVWSSPEEAKNIQSNRSALHDELKKSFEAGFKFRPLKKRQEEADASRSEQQQATTSNTFSTQRGG